MSPTSRYMGGITRSRDLRVISRSRGGHLEKLKVDQSLSPDTCVTHFVCFLGGLQPSKRDRDSTPVLERVPGPRESDFPQVLRGSNSGRIFKDPVEAVDTTQSWLSQPTQKSTQGCERRAALLREKSPAPLTNTEDALSGNARSHIDASLFARSVPQLSFASQKTRTFHTSSHVPYDSTSYNVTDVPDFFMKYKQHRAASSTDLVSLFSISLLKLLINDLFFPAGA